MSSHPSISIKPERPNTKDAISSTKVQQTNLRHVENKARDWWINVRNSQWRPYERNILKIMPNRDFKQRHKTRRSYERNEPNNRKRQGINRSSWKRNAWDMVGQNWHKFCTQWHPTSTYT